jgi:hypothetical protein
VDSMVQVLTNFWAAVSEVFSSAWGLRPKESRLMHGVGIVSLGFLMDAICDAYPNSIPAQDSFADELRPLQDICRWTGGEWVFPNGAKRRWNELQNTSRDIQLLADFLLSQYRRRVWIDRASVG